MKHEPLNTLTQQAKSTETKPWNKAIEEAYNMLVTRISNKIEPNFNKAYDKFPRLEATNLNELNTLKAFYTPCCSVKLITRRDNYIILLTVDNKCLNAGRGANTSELLRTAFDTTKYHGTGIMVEHTLEIAINPNVEAVYKQQYEDMVNRQNLAYYNQKMKIEG